MTPLRLSSTLLAAGLHVTTPAAAPSQASRAVVTGHILDATTRRPVAGAFITLGTLTDTTRTDNAGHFTVGRAPSATPTTTIRRPGYQPLTIVSGRASGPPNSRPRRSIARTKLEVFALDRAWLAQLVTRLERRLQFSLARSEGEIYLTVGDATLQTVLARVVTAG
jgi:hypothetical protein